MATAPLPSTNSGISPVPAQAAPLSEAARIVNTFIAPSKPSPTCAAVAAWWAPFLLMVIVSIVFVSIAGQKVGFPQDYGEPAANAAQTGGRSGEDATRAARTTNEY